MNYYNFVIFLFLLAIILKFDILVEYFDRTEKIKLHTDRQKIIKL